MLKSETQRAIVRAGQPIRVAAFPLSAFQDVSFSAFAWTDFSISAFA
jgi:hypothetical protein